MGDNLITLLKNYRLTIILATIITTLYCIFGSVPDTLYFNQTAVANGEIWRLVSAHLVHSDQEHLIWNLSAFLILSLLMEQHNRKMLLLALISGTLVIDYYLWFNTMGVINYAGFSGVLNTLLVLTLFQQWQNNKQTKYLKILPVIIYFCSLFKIIIEISWQQAIFSHISWQALPQVHLAGFITGTVIIIITVLIKRVDFLPAVNRPNLHHSSE